MEIRRRGRLRQPGDLDHLRCLKKKPDANNGEENARDVASVKQPGDAQDHPEKAADRYRPARAQKSLQHIPIVARRLASATAIWVALTAQA